MQIQTETFPYYYTSHRALTTFFLTYIPRVIDVFLSLKKLLSDFFSIHSFFSFIQFSFLALLLVLWIEWIKKAKSFTRNFLCVLFPSWKLYENQKSFLISNFLFSLLFSLCRALYSLFLDSWVRYGVISSYWTDIDLGTSLIVSFSIPVSRYTLEVFPKVMAKGMA